MDVNSSNVNQWDVQLKKSSENLNRPLQKPTQSSMQYLNLDSTHYERSSLANNTKNKVTTIKDELKYLDLAGDSHFDSIDADVNFAGKKFKNFDKLEISELDQNIKSELITKESKRLAAYNRDDVRKLFKFEENGFEYVPVEKQLLEAAKNFDPTKFGTYADIIQEEKVLALVGEMLKKWASDHKMGEVIVAPLGTIYRSETVIPNSQPVASLTHVDFKKERTSDERDFKGDFKLFWKKHVEKALGKQLTDIEYENLQVDLMVNVWIPLQDNPTENTLAMMDTSRIKEEDLVPFQNTLRVGPFEVPFTVMTLRPSNKQQFIIQSDMKSGDMIIFDTLNTPHTAVTAPRPDAEKNLPRTSLEIRAFIFKK